MSDERISKKVGMSEFRNTNCNIESKAENRNATRNV